MARTDASAKAQETPAAEGPSKVLIAAVIAVLLVIVGGFVWLRSDPFGGLDAAGPRDSIAEGGGVQLYPGRAKQGVPEVHLYEDFQCPYCGELERKNGKSMTRLAAAGDIKLIVHLTSFLDGKFGNDSSTRAASAAFCAADAGKFPALRETVFAAQPAKAGAGYSDATLKAAATKAGITGSAATTFTQCVSKGTYDGYVEDTQKRSNDDGVNGTPQVRINGKDINEGQLNTLLTQSGSFPTVLAQVAK